MSLIKPIIKGRINNLEANFLLDTGASKALLDISLKNKYELEIRTKFPGNLIGFGGNAKEAYQCNTSVLIENKVINDFVLTDLSSLVNSIKNKTGLEIVGVISYSQMLQLGIVLNTKKGTVDFV